VTSARAYEIDGRDADAASFTRAACDPRQSVVVEACAGSGKTWLLVARMLRLLLAGAAPAELLAITFTRKAAQEMRDRLVQLLRELATAPDEQARALLRERGIPEAQLDDTVPDARRLYDRVLSSPQALSIDTFHSWFARLLQIAPLTSGVPHGYTLAEATGELRSEAYGRFMQGLNAEGSADVKKAMLALYEMAGDWNARRLLDAFLDKRAEWWAACRTGEPLDWLRELCGEDGVRDARLTLWDDAALKTRIATLAILLGKGSKPNRERAERIERPLTAGPSAQNFALLAKEFFDDKGAVRRNGKAKDFTKAVDDHYGGDGLAHFEADFEEVAAALQALECRAADMQVLALNQALFTAGAAYVAHYQAVKAEQRVIDFADLEWHAYRLLTNAQHAAYLHSRLDARYRHILLDEFQDTNPLQWNIVRAWLDAYGDDAARPTVFVVGDPKQSIYRFRRAEPRVFAAARDLLQSQGACVLRTNQTRRNARNVIAVLNDSLRANPIYAPQTTAAILDGAVWRLPLVQDEDAAAEVTASDANTTDADTADAAAGERGAAEAFAPLRDPLTTAREEEEDARRLREGRQLARALLRARAELPGLPWSEIMLLVKKRTHLAAYETALREAGIPFVSDRRGGLLQSLEIADLIALLGFLIAPGDNRALAHVLKSPIVGATDDDLIALAQRREHGWWQRLRAAVAEGASPALQRADALLSGWLAAAPHLPVHDLLDRILHDSRLLARYAECAPPTTRGQVLGNIDAFTELALNLDAGRYPSLPKFIEALRRLQGGAAGDAPDEASVDASVDAARILTIHSAKGLEARVVAMLDANHSEAAADDLGILCGWPQDEVAPTHLSAFGRKGERGMARSALFAEEDALQAQEDWNLLYVAATRAKELLIVSGVAGKRGAGGDGIVADSWYARLLNAPQIDCPEDGTVAPAALADAFALPLFEPPALPPEDAGSRVAGEAIDEGIVLHGLLERVTQRGEWPVRLPDAATIAWWLDCSTELAEGARLRAEAILSQPSLERFFNPARYRSACNELDVMAPAGTGASVMRIDRLVVFDDAVWILDYKRNTLASEAAAHAAQLARYREAAQSIFTGKVIRTALIAADGRLVEIDGGGMA